MIKYEIAQEHLDLAAVENGCFVPCIELDPVERVVRTTYAQRGTTSLGAWQGRVLSVVGRVDAWSAADVEAILRRAEDEFVTVCDGYAVEWDGSNHRGVFTSSEAEEIGADWSYRWDQAFDGLPVRWSPEQVLDCDLTGDALPFVVDAVEAAHTPQEVIAAVQPDAGEIQVTCSPEELAEVYAGWLTREGAEDREQAAGAKLKAALRSQMDDG